MKNHFREIHHNGIHIATHVVPKKAPKGLSFITKDSQFLQLGIWNYDAGKDLDAHFHNEFSRNSFKTNEFVYVLKGKIICNLYTEKGDFIETIVIRKNEGILQHNMTHEYKILKKSIIIESKNGPYEGVEKDKTVVRVKKS